MGEFKEDPKPGVPLWLLSFGDMMTNALTFFILMVSMSHQRDYGLVAKGLGSFVVALKSHGLPGMMSQAERAAVFNEFRQRFNLPPEEDPDRREAHADASQLELVRAAAAKALEPHDELFQPAIANFERGSARLSETSKAYIDRLADTLRPARTQVLILEGHARDADANFGNDDRWLAFARAQAVRDYLVEVHEVPAERIEARAWLVEVEPQDAPARSVDARLVTPSKKK